MITAAGGQATYYVCGGLENEARLSDSFFSAHQLRELVSAGHEVGCHGFGHMNYQELGINDVELDIDRNRAFFSEIGIPKAKHFAYPYGCVSPKVKKVCARHFETCRGVQGKVNWASVDLSLICAVPLYSSDLAEEAIDVLLDGITSSGGWLVFFGHGIVANPGYFDATPELLEYIISGTNSRGLPLLNMSDALKWVS